MPGGLGLSWCLTAIWCQAMQNSASPKTSSLGQLTLFESSARSRATEIVIEGVGTTLTMSGVEDWRSGELL